jgi:predicted transcriptional regulator YdeE
MPEEPRLVDVQPFVVSGISVRTVNSDEAEPSKARIPGLWKRFMDEGIAEKIPGQVPDSPVYGVYSAYESDASGPYTLTAGIAVTEPAPGFESVNVVGGRYLVFEGTGEMPGVVVATWLRIWSYFDGSTRYRRRFATDFEANPGPTQVAIHVGV